MIWKKQKKIWPVSKHITKCIKSLTGINNSKSRDEIYDKHKHEDWFVNIPNRRGGIDDMAEYCVYLIADNDNQMQLSCFWCGYFEQLIGAEIETDNSDMKFTI